MTRVCASCGGGLPDAREDHVCGSCRYSIDRGWSAEPPVPEPEASPEPELDLVSPAPAPSGPRRAAFAEPAAAPRRPRRRPSFDEVDLAVEPRARVRIEEVVPPAYRGNDVWERGASSDQVDLFADPLSDQRWQLHYRGMPEYRHADQKAKESLVVVLAEDWNGGDPELAIRNGDGGRRVEQLSVLDGGGGGIETEALGALGRHPGAVKVNFESTADRDRFVELVDADLRDVAAGRPIVFPGSIDGFARIVEQTVTEHTQSLWWPEAEIRRMVDKEYRVPGTYLPDRNWPKYPIYIPSKGRAETATTPGALDRLGVEFWIVVEPPDEGAYAARFGRDRLLVLPADKEPGVHVTRTWIKRDSIERLGAARHWQMDDNIQGFYRYNDNLKVPVGDPTVLRVMEDFVDRYENVALAGPHYFMFVSRKVPGPPITLNTRIYSCTLVDNSIPHEWDLRFNEDTDISLRVLRDGYAIVQFSAFLQYKTTTMTVAGGNTEAYLAMDGRREFVEMLRDRHPDVVTLTRKFGRWHHHVDYGPFRSNRLRLRPGVDPAEFPAIDDYGMKLFVDGVAR